MIHVVGNAAIDTILSVERFPRPGETIVARGVVEDLGGKGANQAVVIARSGERVRLVAALGDDTAGARIRRSLDAEGVATDGLVAWSGATDRCLVSVDAAGENMIISLIDAAYTFDPVAGAGRLDAVASGDWILMQGNLRPGATRACLALAKQRGATTALNPSPTWPAAEYDWSLVDLAIVNRGEAIELGARDDPFAAARALREAGVGAVALTLGAAGAALVAGDGERRAPAPRIAAIDAVGAGDVFCGALIAARAGGRAWSEALRIAVDAAAIAVTRRGAQSSFPTRAEMTGVFSQRSVEEHRA
jgi:ribokinase